MENSDFLNSSLVKNLLLFNIFDIDEFVLSEVERIKNSNMIDNWDVRSARRYSYEIFQVGENEFEEEEISSIEYLNRKEKGECYWCFSKLNYEDFEKGFPLNELGHWYGDEWLYEFHYNKCFFPAVKDWIDKTSGDSSKRLRIRELLKLLKKSKKALENIEVNWKEPNPINEIQKKVIEIHIRFDEVMLDGISRYYTNIFPELFLSTEKSKSIHSKQDILNKLINPSQKERFLNYENKLVSQKFLSEDRDKWLQLSADLVRFYNYCERKEIINRAYKNKSKGMKLLRQLYGFYEGESIDSPRNKRLKQDNAQKGQFNFLDII